MIKLKTKVKVCRNDKFVIRLNMKVENIAILREVGRQDKAEVGNNEILGTVKS